MTSNKSYAKSPLFTVVRTQLYSLRMVLILFGVVLFCLPLLAGFLMLEPAFLNPDSNWNSYNSFYIEMQGRVMLFAGMLPLLGFAAALAAGQFSYLHKRQMLDFYHAVPVRRTPLYFGRVLLGGAALVLGVLLVVLSQVLVVAIQFATITVGGNLLADVYGAIWMNGAVMALYALAAYLFTVLVFVATAALWEAVVSFLVLSAAYPLTALLVLRIMESSFLLPGFSDDILSLTLFSPFLTGFAYQYNALFNAPQDAWVLPLLLAQILVCGAVSFWIFRRRPSERAESGEETWFRRVVRFCAAAAGAFLGSWVFLFVTDSYPGYLLGAVLGAAAAWVLLELLYAHTLRGLLKKLPASAAGLTAFAVVNVLIAFGFGSLQLPAVDAVDAVSVSGGIRSGDTGASLTNVNGSAAVFTESGVHFVETASFDDSVVEETHALLQEMLEYQRDTYFPYHPTQAMRLGDYTMLDETKEQYRVWISLYEDGEQRYVAFAGARENDGVAAIYAHAGEIVQDPLYTQNNPELALIDALEAIGKESAGPGMTLVLSEAEKEAVSAAYRADLLAAPRETAYTMDKDAAMENYCLYFNGDVALTMQGGIVDDRYPAVGMTCTLRPQEEGQEAYAAEESRYLDPRSFPETVAAMEAIWASHGMSD